MFLDYTFYPDSALPIEVSRVEIPASLFFARAESFYEDFPVGTESNKKLKIDYGLE